MLDQQDSLDFLLLRVGRAHHNLIRQSLEKTGLGRGQRGQPPILFALGQQDGLTNSELAALLEVTPATITNTVKRMEKAGFVVRRRGTVDERVSRVYLTDAGRAIQSEIKVMQRQVEAVITEGFTQEEQALLRRLLTQLLDNLQQATS